MAGKRGLSNAQLRTDRQFLAAELEDLVGHLRELPALHVWVRLHELEHLVGALARIIRDPLWADPLGQLGQARGSRSAPRTASGAGQSSER